ncbi:NADH-quinone oxidoreductase subunit NuoG [Paraphotobacterium marinum]
MGTIYIDDQPVEFKDGDNVLDAAKNAGIEVPYFCYHPAMGSVGSCRACAMETVPQKEGERPRLVMSCTVKAADGMKFTLNSGKSEQVHKNVIEFNMTNHPNDCPVCDEGGDCQLQDMTVLSGHAYRRYDGKKRTVNNQYLGPLVWNTANRCITCYRCSRFYQDYALGDDFGPLGSRNQVVFKRIDDGHFDSPFAGNIITVCPTGTFTDKVYRRKYSRTWMLDKSESICNHCSVGCNIEVGSRKQTLRVIKPKENESVNKYFICDKGRYAPHAADSSDRPLDVYINGTKEAELNHDAGKLLKETLQNDFKYGGILGSEREDLISNVTLKELSEELNVPFSSFNDSDVEDKVKLAVSLSANSPSIDDIEVADCIFIVGEITEQATMLDLAARQALKKEVPVYLINSAPTLFAELEKKYSNLKRLSIPTNEINDELTKIKNQNDDDGFHGNLQNDIANANKPVILGMVDSLSLKGIQLLNEINENFEKSKLGFALPASGSYGAALVSQPQSCDKLLTSIENGNLKTLLIVGNDPLSGNQRKRWKNAIAKLEKLVVIDYIYSETAKEANLFLPSTAHVERNGVLINFEGRVQSFEASYKKELPLFDPEGLRKSLSSNVQTKINEFLNKLFITKPSVKSQGVLLTAAQIKSLINTSHINFKEVKTSNGINVEVYRWFGEESVANFSKEISSLSPQKNVLISKEIIEDNKGTECYEVKLKNNGKEIIMPFKVSKQLPKNSIALQKEKLNELNIFELSNIQLEFIKPLFTDASQSNNTGGY